MNLPFQYKTDSSVSIPNTAQVEEQSSVNPRVQHVEVPSSVCSCSTTTTPQGIIKEVIIITKKREASHFTTSTVTGRTVETSTDLIYLLQLQHETHRVLKNGEGSFIIKAKLIN